MRPVDRPVKAALDNGLVSVEADLRADVVSFVGPILPTCETRLRDALAALESKRGLVAVILDTPGGIVEVVERMVTATRAKYKDVTVIVPDHAMSAGTLFALSADRVMMDHLSCLGPIDPQVEKDGKLVPVTPYLSQFERLSERARQNELTPAEHALLGRLDLGDLHQYGQARALSRELSVKWLVTYKFKHWRETETRRQKVSPRLKEQRARKIAELLNDPERWLSHGRPLDRETLRNEVNLKVDDLEKHESLHQHLGDYFQLLKDYVRRENATSFIHSRGYFNAGHAGLEAP